MRKILRCLNKSTKYVKIGGSGSGSTRTKVSSKPNSATRHDSNMNYNNSLLKLRRGSNNTETSNSSMRYGSIEDIKRRTISSKDSIKTFNSGKKNKRDKNGSIPGMKPTYNNSMKNTSFNSTLSKGSLKENIKGNFYNSKTPLGGERRSEALLKNHINSSAMLSNCESSCFKNTPHLLSTGSIGSQSSIESSTLSVLKGLNEVNKVLKSKNIDPRKELIKEGVSIPVVTQLNTFKKINKKKSSYSK